MILLLVFQSLVSSACPVDVDLDHCNRCLGPLLKSGQYPLARHAINSTL